MYHHQTQEILRIDLIRDLCYDVRRWLDLVLSCQQYLRGGEQAGDLLICLVISISPKASERKRQMPLGHGRMSSLVSLIRLILVVLV